MKKSAVAALLFLLITLSVHGRRVSGFGIKMGSAVTNCYYTAVNSDPHSDLEIDLVPYLGYDIKWAQLAPQKALFSPYIGIYYTLRLTDKLSLKPEISYVKKGLSFSHSKYERIIYRVEIAYLEIPLSLGYRIYQGKKSSGEIYLGGYGALKIDSAKKVAYHDSPVEKIRIDTVASSDWGIHVGAGFKRKFSGGTLLFDIRVFLGLGDIFSPANSGVVYDFGTQETKNTGAYVTLGYEL